MSWLPGIDRALGLFTWLVAGLLVLMLFVGPQLVADDEPAGSSGDPSPAYGSDSDGDGSASEAPTDAGQDGQALFADNCGSCHTLAAAGSTGSIGPGLDGLAISSDEAASIIADGRGSMPAFGGDLNEAQITAIAEFVSTASGS